MAVTSVNANAGTTDSSQTTQTLNNELDRNAFMNLLVTQLQNQDPMKPMENTEFISQMAQFSALEQMQQVSAKLDIVNQSTQFGNVAALIGHTVTAVDADGQQIAGKVDAVMLQSGQPMLLINKTTVDPSSVTQIAN